MNFSSKNKVAILGFGTWLYFFNLINLFYKERNNLIIIVPKNIKVDEKLKKNFNFFFIREYLPRNIISILELIDILRILKKEKIKLLHIASGRPFWLFPLYIIYKLAFKGKIVFTLHEPIKRKGDPSTFKIYKYLDYYLVIKLADYLIFGGKQILQIFKNSMSTKAKLIQTSLGIFTQLNSSTKKTYIRKNNRILFFGRIEKYKGLKILIKSTKYIKNDYELIIAGAGKIEKNQTLDRLINRGKVKIYNYFIDNDFLIKLFSTSSVVVVPYLTGTQSGVISTAFSFNTPVIATKIGSIHEIITERKTGFVVKPNDPKSLADKINLIINNEDLQKKFQKNIEKEKIKINNELYNKLKKIYF